MNPSSTDQSQVRSLTSTRSSSESHGSVSAPLPVDPASVDRDPSYTLYKPTANGKGAAVRFCLSRRKSALFLEAARQSGEKQFDWESKIIMKWGVQDLGQALATLQGRQSQAKLFHQSEKANCTLELSFRDEANRAPYLLSISRQESVDKSIRRVMIPISHPEAVILETAFRTAISRLLRW